jgi:hypothetical protein
MGWIFEPPNIPNKQIAIHKETWSPKTLQGGSQRASWAPLALAHLESAVSALICSGESGSSINACSLLGWVNIGPSCWPSWSADCGLKACPHAGLTLLLLQLAPDDRCASKRTVQLHESRAIGLLLQSLFSIFTSTSWISVRCYGFSNFIVAHINIMHINIYMYKRIPYYYKNNEVLLCLKCNLMKIHCLTPYA